MVLPQIQVRNTQGVCDGMRPSSLSRTERAEGNPCLARMASLNSVCVRNNVLYCRTESSLSEAQKDIQLTKGSFCSEMALAFLYLLYSALLHMQSAQASAFQ